MNTMREISILAALALSFSLIACGGAQDDWTPPSLDVASPSEGQLFGSETEAPAIRVQASGADNVGLSKLRCRIYDYIESDPPVDKPAINHVFAYYETPNSPMDVTLELPHAYTSDYYALEIESLDLSMLKTTKIVKIKIRQPLLTAPFTDYFTTMDSRYGDSGLPSYWAREYETGSDGVVELANSPDGSRALHIRQIADPMGSLGAIRRIPRLSAGKISFTLRVAKLGSLDIYLKNEDAEYLAVQFNISLLWALNETGEKCFFPVNYRASPQPYRYYDEMYSAEGKVRIDIVFDSALDDPQAVLYIDGLLCPFTDNVTRAIYNYATHYSADDSPRLKHEINQVKFLTFTGEKLKSGEKLTPEFYIDDFTVTPMSSPDLSLVSLQ
jgi:hypothetical protein